MISNRPYLLRAFHEWIVDSDCTPIIVFDANNPRCKMPKDYAEGGEIVFNISYKGVKEIPFDWMFIDYNTLQNAAEANGLQCELLIEGEHYDYLARLSF